MRTYIQSGNVLFDSDAPRGSLKRDLEAMLERRFGLPLVVINPREGPEYQRMTIRNWTTTTKLLGLLEEHRSA